MGRELRMVPKGWEHPTCAHGEQIPMLEHQMETFMYPDDDENEIPRDQYMMYESCTEGTPISPAFATKEELARWLADTGASSFGKMTSTYEAWLACINRGSAISAVMGPGGFQSGVSAMAELDAGGTE